MPNKTGSRNPERDASIFKMFVNDDLTLSQIGQRFEMSRQRIQQILIQHDRTVYFLHQQRIKARQRLRVIVNKGSLPYSITCYICGQDAEVSFPNIKNCSPTCSKIYQLFKYHLDEDRKAKHRKAVAKHDLNTRKTSQLHYDNVMNGTTTSHGNWFIRGSVTYHWALRAYYMKWPLFDNLPEVYRNQILRDEGVIE